MNETIDNQQATSHQLAWLAGIWDGEGTFTIIYDKRKRSESYNPRVSLSNTSLLMINEILKILDSYGVKGHLWEEKPRKKAHQTGYHITINKLKNVKIVTELMLPYLINKKPNAEILIRFVNSRLKYKKTPIQDGETGRITGMKKKGYNEEEKSFYTQLKELHGGASTTTRVASTVLS